MMGQTTQDFDQGECCLCPVGHQKSTLTLFKLAVRNVHCVFEFISHVF